MFYTFYGRIGDNVYIKLKDPVTNKSRCEKIKYKPSLFIKTEDKDSEWRSIFDEPLKKINFKTCYEAKLKAEEYKQIQGIGLNGNSNYENQCVIELFDGKIPDYDPTKISIGKLDIEVDAPEFPKPEDHKWPINAITIENNISKKFYTFFLKNDEFHDADWEWDKAKSPDYIQKLNIEYEVYNKESDLLLAVLTKIQELELDVICGYNSYDFDIPYFVLRCFKILGEEITTSLLSPFDKITTRMKKNAFGNDVVDVEIFGLPHIDYLEAYRKHTYIPRESYKLDFIAQEELGEKKIEYDGSLYDLYRDDPQKFIDYNIHDVNLIKRLDDKLDLFGLIFVMSYYCLSNYEDTLGTTQIWEKLIAKFLYNKKKVPLFSRNKRTEQEFEGAYVKKTIPGLYEWVVSFDLNSLYPHCEMQWNIGIDTHIPYEKLPQELKDLKNSLTFQKLLTGEVDLSLLKKYNVTMAPNLQFYTLEKRSFFSEIKEDLYRERKIYKKKMIEAEKSQIEHKNDEEKISFFEILETKMNNFQLGLKILLNAGYGAVASIHFLYYMIENAEAITLSGQFVNRFTTSSVDKSLMRIFNTTSSVHVAGDTDSGYFTIKPFIDQLPKGIDIQKKVDYADEFCKEVISPLIDKESNFIKDYFNCYEQKMVWAREVIADKAIWLAMKNYFMTVWDSEGVRFQDEPKFKMKGVEAVKASYPDYSRKALKEIYQLSLKQDVSAIHKKIESVRDEFYKYDVNSIAIPTRVNGVIEYYDPETRFKKGAQAHVKSAINHNLLIKELGLRMIPEIKDGNSIKWLKLKKPNPYDIDVIGFHDRIPKQFNLEKYVDRNEILEKGFMSPCRRVLDVMGWPDEETITLF